MQATGGRRVRIVMTLLVRDEADIVAATVEHHLAAGVDFVVATDNGSVDGTTEILERYRDAGVLELWHEPGRDYEQARWVTAMARRAAESHGADWVINGDADEFLWPGAAAEAGRTAIADALAAVDSRCGTVEMVRDNLVADPARRGPWPSTHVLRDTLSLSARGTRIGNKVCHRADPAVTVGVGNHSATGALGELAPERPLTILHVPDRGLAQFTRKVANAGAAFAANTRLDPGIGWHMREDYRLLLDGELARTWARRQPDAAAVSAGLADGTLVRDSRLTDRLTALLPTAVVPAALKDVLREP
ncbi:glycosyltransferase family 2 protein [Amycolatopsis stemonae]